MYPNPYVALSIFFSFTLLVFLLWKSGVIAHSFRRSKDRRKEEMEDILKQLYHVEYSGRKATLNAMAGALKVSVDKLLDVIEYLAEKKLIHVKENVISLTKEGTEYALEIIRIHRLWEKYLSEKTGIDKSEWHIRAEQMEHTLSSEDADELYLKLGSPRFDPHGDPIPLKSGEIMEPFASHLSSVEPGSLVKIVHIEDEPEVIYRQILDKKLQMGQQIKVLESGDHFVKFESEGSILELSAIVASNIGIRELAPDELYEEKRVRLTSLKQGEQAKILDISKECRGAARRRLLDLGFISGSAIEIAMPGPLKEPNAYLIRNTLIALRNDQAELIQIEKI